METCHKWRDAFFRDQQCMEELAASETITGRHLEGLLAVMNNVRNRKLPIKKLLGDFQWCSMSPHTGHPW